MIHIVLPERLLGVEMPDRKPAARRQRRNKPNLIVLDGGAKKVSVHAAPKGLLQETRASWQAFWGSPLARIIESTDLPALRRLFLLYDEHARCWRAFRTKRIVAGSRGQVRLNPLGQFICALASEIRQLERVFGFSPRARLQLGLTYGEAQRSLEDLAREVQEE